MDSKEKRTTTSSDEKCTEAKQTVQQNTAQDSSEQKNASEADKKTDEKNKCQHSEDNSPENKKEDNVEEENAPNEKEPLTKEEELTKQLESLQKELDEDKDRYLRLAAEFDNYRRRTMKEKTELILNGSEKCINSILPVLDDLERALANMQKTEDIKAINEGIELIYNKFVQILSSIGVKEIETLDKALDTDYHEAIALVPVQDESQKGKIIDCTQKGYTLNEKVIRHAKVVIGQ